MKLKKKKILKIILLLLINILIITNNVIAINSSNITYGDHNNINTNKMVDIDSKSKNLKTKENEVIVVYSKSDWLTDLQVKFNSIGKYRETDILRIDDVNIEEIDGIDKVITEDGDMKVTLVKSDRYSTEELINLLKDKSYVKSVTPNYIYPVQSLTNDPYLQYQYALESISGNGGNTDADINPMSTNSDEEKVIAIIDTGLNYEGTEIEDALWTNPYDKSIIPGIHGYNFWDHNEDLSDDTSHGTLVASEIGAKANDSKGMTGSILDSSNIKIMMLKCGINGGLSLSAIYEAYNYIYNVQELGTNVVAINNSWGGFFEKESFDSQSGDFRPLIEMVGKNGAVTVTAAGNDSTEIDKNGKGQVLTEQEDGSYAYEERYYFPSGIDSNYIITVGATNEYGYINKGSSNYGEGVDIVAPGVNILGLQSYKGFTSSLLSEEEREKYCEIFYDFDDEDLTLFEKEQVGNVTISATDDIFYGRNGKSVKITVDVKEEDFSYNEGLKNCIIKIPLNVPTLGNQISSNKYVDLQMRGDTKKQGQEQTDGQDYVATAYLDDGVNRVGMFFINDTGDTSSWRSWCSSDTFSKYFNELHHPSELSNTTMYIEFEAYKTGKFVFYVDDFAVSKPIDKIDVDLRKSYYKLTGTSFAAPFVAGAIATMSNIHEDYDAIQLKNAVLDNAIRKDKLEGYVAENRMLNIYKLYGKTIITEDITSITNKDVTISISSNNINEGVKLQYKIDDEEWLDYKNSFNLTKNAKISTRVVDAKDSLECQSLNVNNIDKEPPIITGVEEKIYQEGLELPTPIITDNVEVGSIILTKDGKIVNDFKSGREIKEPGTYELKAIDTAQNETIIRFTVQGTVFEKELISIEVTTLPNKISYIERQDFDTTGIKVTARYNDGSSNEITNFTVTDGNNLTVEKTSITISYTENGITKITTQAITVTQKLEINFIGYNEVNKDGIKFIDNIKPSTTMEETINNIKTNGTIKVYKDDRKITDNKIKISTGMKVKISLYNENYEFIVVVKGDTNGDGECNLKDLLQINKHRLNKTMLTAEYLLAGDVNKDNEVNLRDLLQVNKYRLGKIKIF